MKKNYILTGLCLIITIVLNAGCKKEFLDAKPSSTILQPTTLDDFQALLEQNSFYSPALGSLASDEYNYISDAVWLSARSTTERNSYTWAKNLYEGEIGKGDWEAPYTCIFYTNNVLAGLNNVKDDKDIARLNFLKGWALFLRAFSYFELVNSYATAYDPNSANVDLGVPIKLDPSVDDIRPRSTVQQTYNQILNDLKTATPLLDPSLQFNNRERPSKIAAHALFSRIYLNMREYELAEKHADSTLKLYDKLIDYNTVSQVNIEPFTKFNDELIFYKTANIGYPSLSGLANSYTVINPALIQLYDDGDLRKVLYFSPKVDGGYIMKLGYTGFTSLYGFTGLATDEIYLIKAECAARRNDLPAALLYLNQLMKMRIDSDVYSPVEANDTTNALNTILLERQKELVWRNMRWFDLKRLNKEGANITLTRSVNDQTYVLPPNDPRYVFPIPDNEIQYSNIEQNIR